jgi:hypothetical protein
LQFHGRTSSWGPEILSGAGFFCYYNNDILGGQPRYFLIGLQPAPAQSKRFCHPFKGYLVYKYREQIMPQPKIHIPLKQIEDFCRRWKIAAFSRFGSVLRDDFAPDRDIDVLVTFEPNGGITFDNRVEMI